MVIIIVLSFIDYLSFEDVSWFVNKYTDLLKIDLKTDYICNNVSLNEFLSHLMLITDIFTYINRIMLLSTNRI